MSVETSEKRIKELLIPLFPKGTTITLKTASDTHRDGPSDDRIFEVAWPTGVEDKRFWGFLRVRLQDIEDHDTDPPFRRQFENDFIAYMSLVDKDAKPVDDWNIAAFRATKDAHKKPQGFPI